MSFSYETMGELFRETQQHLLELTLWERLVRVFFKMIVQLAAILNVDMEDVPFKMWETLVR